MSYSRRCNQKWTFMMKRCGFTIVLLMSAFVSRSQGRIQGQIPSSCRGVYGGSVFSNLSLTESSDMFERLGYRNRAIPPDLNHIHPLLLHEDSVVHYLNDRRTPKKVNSGATADLYQGIFQDSGKKVLVKILKEKNPDDILEEAILSRYLQCSPFSPKVYGVLPYGPDVDDLTLVVEYLDNTTTVQELLDLGKHVNQCQWLSIAYQAALGLLFLHEKYVIYNDFHENNVLISWQGSSPHVYLIDFGVASFREGEKFRGYNMTDRNRSSFLAPEVWVRTSTPESDFYSFGDVMLMIAEYVGIPCFEDVSTQCHKANPEDRLHLSQAKEIFADLLEENCPDTLENNFREVSGYTFTLRHLHETLSTDTESCFPFDKNIYFNHQGEEQEVDFKLPVPVILPELLRVIQSLDTWVSSKEDMIYTLETRNDTKSLVIVKCFKNESFALIRHDAVVNFLMNSTDAVTPFFGITPKGEDLRDFCIVQKDINHVTSFNDFINRQFDSDIQIFILLAAELTRSVGMFHQKGMVLNYIDPHNLYIDEDNNCPRIRFFDYKCVSENKIWYWQVEGSETAFTPRDTVITFTSDIYSIGMIFYPFLRKSSDLSVRLMIDRCVHDNPHVRPTAAELYEFLRMQLVKRFPGMTPDP